MPSPTNPPCIGSCPLPPPATSPTLPFLGASLRMITFGSYSTRIRSACAAAIPAMASLTSVSGVLISFLSRVVTAASAIAASSYLLRAVGKTRRNMNMPSPFPISSPRPIAPRFSPSNCGLKGGVSSASSTAPTARPLPPISRMRFSRWTGVRAARGRGEGSIPRPPGALPSCRLSRRDTVLLRPRPRRFDDGNGVWTHGSRQMLVDERVIDPGAEWPANEWHPGGHPEIEVLPRDRVRAVPNEQPPDPRPEVTCGIQGGHLDRGKQADQGGHDETDRDWRQVGRRGDPVLDDAEDADHEERRNDDLGSSAPPPGILGQVIGAALKRRMTCIPNKPGVRPVRPEDEPAIHAAHVAPRDLASGLVRNDDPIPHEGHADGCDERADELGADVPGYLRPRETTAPRQGQRDGRVEMCAGYRTGGVDGQGDREPPEKSRRQQAGLEAIAACPRDREGDEAVAEENQNECSQHFGQVFLSPAFGYCHYFLLLVF